MATRHADGSLPVEDFNLELENQSGEKVQMGSETDQRYERVTDSLVEFKVLAAAKMAVVLL